MPCQTGAGRHQRMTCRYHFGSAKMGGMALMGIAGVLDVVVIHAILVGFGVFVVVMLRIERKS